LVYCRAGRKVNGYCGDGEQREHGKIGESWVVRHLIFPGKVREEKSGKLLQKPGDFAILTLMEGWGITSIECQWTAAFRGGQQRAAAERVR